MSKIEKVVLAYSGGLDTSIILKWLKNHYECDVICMTADLGQGEEMDGIEEKALSTGAVKAYVEDLREEFVRDYVFPMFRANALYEGRYLLGTAIARPLISKRMVEIAEMEGAQAVSHGATGKGNDQVRFELATMALNPRLITIAPWREWELKSRTDLMNYAKENNISIPVSREKPWSIDANLLHTSFEGGELEDPWNSPGPDCYRNITPPEMCPDEPEEITIDFEAGNPIAVNSVKYSPAALLATLNKLGGKHGVGRVDMVENRFVGMKSRGVYETPGGTILAAAHRDLEGLCMDREMMHLRDSLIPKYAEMVYYGYWFSPEREALQAMIDKSQEKVTGTVRVKLYKGNCVPLGRKSPFSMYSSELATFEEDYVYDQADAAGFIKLVGLRLKGRMQQSKWGGKDLEDTCEQHMAEKKMWGGRFAEGTAASMEAYSESVSYDWQLYAEDIRGSQAHARVLARQGFLTESEARQLCDGLDAVRSEIEAGEFTWKTSMEDVHMNIESRLTELIGPVGGKLHTARSRNDQVALDFRLHVAARLGAWQQYLASLIGVYISRAEEHRDTLLPGCTHFQPAQPVSLAHHLLAYCQMFKRDFERVSDCLKRVLVMPLGAAALAGTTHPVNPQAVAEDLGVDAVFANSMDAVSDRDFALEAVFAGSLIMTHLSRMCEEIIIWANPNFGYVKLPDQYATGSSIMPQKKNPDACELMRGKTGRVVGSLMGLLVLLKGLPMTYNRDLQEDKEPFFDTDKTVSSSLNIMNGMLGQLRFMPEAMLASVRQGFLNATELADYLAAKGVPFREAHHVTGAAVAFAEGKGVGLEDLNLDELKQFSSEIDEDVFAVLDYKACVQRRTSHGGTGPESVDRQIDELKVWLASI